MTNNIMNGDGTININAFLQDETVREYINEVVLNEDTNGMVYSLWLDPEDGEVTTLYGTGSEGYINRVRIYAFNCVETCEDGDEAEYFRDYIEDRIADEIDEYNRNVEWRNAGNC